LGTHKHPAMKDTIVMSNYGYFQLKANPGVWQVKPKPNSRSSELYEVGFDGKVQEEQTVVISDFLGNVATLDVSKRLGKEGEQLLAPVESDSLFDSISSLWGSKNTLSSNETIHVFSLATGHLYERFLKIMFLSVIKHTNQPVKFWLLANFFVA